MFLIILFKLLGVPQHFVLTTGCSTLFCFELQGVLHNIVTSTGCSTSYLFKIWCTTSYCFNYWVRSTLYFLTKGGFTHVVVYISTYFKLSIIMYLTDVPHHILNKWVLRIMYFLTAGILKIILQKNTWHHFTNNKPFNFENGICFFFVNRGKKAKGFFYMMIIYQIFSFLFHVEPIHSFCT